MNQKYRIGIWILLTGTALTISCCKKKNPSVVNGPTSSGVILDFYPMWNGVALEIGIKDYYKSDSEIVRVGNWAMILSDVSLVRTDDSKVKLGDGYLNVDFANKRTKFTFETAPAGDYKAISFTLGVDTPTNHGDPALWPATHPLNANFTGLHWAWSSGYIFQALEGNYKGKGDLTWKGFTYHTATDALLRKFTMSHTFSLSSSVRKTARIEFSCDKFFESPNKISIQNGAFSQSSSPSEVNFMLKLLENAPAVYKVTKVE